MTEGGYYQLEAGLKLSGGKFVTGFFKVIEKEPYLQISVVIHDNETKEDIGRKGDELHGRLESLLGKLGFKPADAEIHDGIRLYQHTGTDAKSDDMAAAFIDRLYQEAKDLGTTHIFKSHINAAGLVDQKKALYKKPSSQMTVDSPEEALRKELGRINGYAQDDLRIGEMMKAAEQYRLQKNTHGAGLGRAG